MCLVNNNACLNNNSYKDFLCNFCDIFITENFNNKSNLFVVEANQPDAAYSGILLDIKTKFCISL